MNALDDLDVRAATSKPSIPWLALPLLLAYQLAAILALLVGSPFLLWRSFRHRREVLERLGLRAPSPPPGGIWFHAASLGEQRALEPLLEERRTSPGPPGDLLTVTSVSARKTVLGARYGLTVSYAPLDVWPVLWLFCRRLRPRAIIIVETELWPAWLFLAARRGIPVAIVSGRISDRSWARRRWWLPLIGPLLRTVRIALAQSETAARRFRQAGASPVAVTGNLKHRAPASPLRARKEDGRFVWIIGSLRQGEEAILDVAQRLLSQAASPPTKTYVVLAPRHLREMDRWAEACQKRGVTVIRRSEGVADSTGRLRQLLEDRSATGLREWLEDTLTTNQPVLLLIDVHGELGLWYSVGDVAYVGGTLNGLGGHSLFEPAALHRPVLYGPSVHGVADVAEVLEREAAGWRIDDAEECLERLVALRAHPARLREAQAQAGEAARQLGGAATRTLNALRELGFETSPDPRTSGR